MYLASGLHEANIQTRLITIDSRIQSAQKKKLNRSIDSQNKRTHNRTWINAPRTIERTHESASRLILSVSAWEIKVVST